MAFTTARNKLNFWQYRLGTICKSIKTLYTLPPEKVESFLNSYNIYDNDWRNEAQLIEEMGPDYYNTVKKKLVDYYSVLNHLCAIGQVEKMYIPPAMDLSRSIIANQNLFEEKMAHDLQVGPQGKVLDIGCGRGRIANHISRLTGAHVTGINLDPNQLEAANRFTESEGRRDHCSFQKWDLNEQPFPFADASFDAMYQVQVFSLAKDLLGLFKELHRMLKPGGRLACLDWMCFSKYNAQDPYHADLMKRIKPLIGAIGTPSVDEYVDLLQRAGFKIVVNENPSIDGLQAPLIEKADTFFTRVAKLIYFCVRCKLLPAHFKVLFERLTKDGKALIEADRLRLVTTTYYIVGEKQ